MDLFQALMRDKAELKRRNQLSQRCEAFLVRVTEREAASQVEAKTLLTSVVQRYETWLDKNHRCFQNLLEALREETALLLVSQDYKVSPISQLLQQSPLDSEDEKKFAQMPEMEALLILNEHCNKACSRAQKVWQTEYEEDISQSFSPLLVIAELKGPMPNYLTQLTSQALAKFGSYAGEDEESELRKRGPVRIGSGVYTGQWNLKNQRHGFGTFLTETGDLYEGYWRNDQKCGKGRQIYAKDGRVYIGDWVQNQREGIGYVWHFSGDEFSGPFANNKPNGIGMYKFRDGGLRFGEYQNGKRSGRSATFWTDGAMRIGFCQADVWHGKGLYVNRSGDMYYGDFAEDTINGAGCYVWSDGDVYKGELKNDLQNGRGRLTHPGKYEEGLWVDGVKRS